MSKEKVRQIVETRYHEWQGLDDGCKSYPNFKEKPTPADGMWCKLAIEHVLRKTTSVGHKPCTARTGVIVISVFERLDVGTCGVSRLTDELEEWFSHYQTERFRTDAAYTVDVGEDKAKNYYLSIVYVPFRFN